MIVKPVPRLFTEMAAVAAAYSQFGRPKGPKADAGYLPIML